MTECQCVECSPPCEQYADRDDLLCIDCMNDTHRPDRDDEDEVSQ